MKKIIFKYMLTDNLFGEDNPYFSDNLDILKTIIESKKLILGNNYKYIIFKMEDITDKFNERKKIKND